jgi:hypothetical protein
MSDWEAGKGAGLDWRGRITEGIETRRAEDYRLGSREPGPGPPGAPIFRSCDNGDESAD